MWAPSRKTFMSSGSTLPVTRDSGPPTPERRKSARFRAQNPSFVGMNGNSTGVNLELHQIFDLSEEGMSFQNSTPLEVGEVLDFSVDLAKPETYFQSSGRVMWTDESGRTGVRFQKTSEDDADRLQQWIAANLSPQTAAESPAEEGPAPIYSPAGFSSEIPPGESPSPFHTYVSGLLASEDVKQEVESLAFDMDSALQIVVQRALSLTRATGAAIALADGIEMVCRATSGPDAPPLGARLQVGSGFSGECIRTGQLLLCEDSETNELVDRESCRALDIRSIMAAPIRSSEGVIGLVEIFSPDAGAFTNGDKSVLQGMAEIVLDAVQRGVQNVEGASQAEASPQATDDLVRSLAEAHTRLAAPEAQPAVVPKRIARLPLLLIVAAAIIVVLLAIWLIVSGWREGGPDVRPRAFIKQSGELNRQASLESSTLEDLRGMAANGDPLAEFTLGLRYATGSDAPQDYSEAVRWFSAAAEQGHVMAQSTLGAYYWAGRGVPQDFHKAYFWALIAQSAGDEASRARVPFLVSRLNRNELISVQHQVEDWMKQRRQSKPAPVKN
jgi:GAF domain-containing protein